VVKLVCDREINVTLVLSDKTSVQVTNSAQDKSEAEIIQDGLDVFGGVVIK